MLRGYFTIIVTVLFFGISAQAGHYWNAGVLKPGQSISVCFVASAANWENDPYFPEFHALIWDYMRDIESAANIRFVDHGRCNDTLDANGNGYYRTDIRIISPRVARYPHPANDGQGLPPSKACVGFRDENGSCVRDQYGNCANDGWGSWGSPPFALESQRTCMYNLKLGPDGDEFGVPWRNHTLHEIGHAIGLAHEHERRDVNVPSCFQEQGYGGGGTSYITPYDRESVMHYKFGSNCNIDGNYSHAGLSTYDQLALRIMYPEATKVAEYVGKTVITTSEYADLRMTWQQQGANLNLVAHDIAWEINGSVVDRDSLFSRQFKTAGNYNVNFRYRSSFTGVSHSFSQNIGIQVLAPSDFKKRISAPLAAQTALVY